MSNENFALCSLRVSFNLKESVQSIVRAGTARGRGILYERLLTIDAVI